MSSAATIWKWAVVLAVTIAIVYLIYYLIPNPKPVPIVVNSQGNTPVVVIPPVVHGSTGLSKPVDHNTSGVITIITPPHQIDSTHSIPGDTINLLIPSDPNLPPIVNSTDTSIHVTYQQVVDPWIVFKPEYGLGASITSVGQISPLGFVSGLRAWSDWRLGAALDRGGLGAALSLEPLDRLEVIAKFNLLKIDDSKASLGVAYRF